MHQATSTISVALPGIQHTGSLISDKQLILLTYYYIIQDDGPDLFILGDVTPNIFTQTAILVREYE